MGNRIKNLEENGLFFPPRDFHASFLERYSIQILRIQTQFFNSLYEYINYMWNLDVQNIIITKIDSLLLFLQKIQQLLS